MQIAEGLAYSHHRLVLHLDVKPGNVRVLGRRQAKILDFGIARLATSGAPPPGAMVGTAGYVPPEQVMSKTVDARSDVFAFGALAYELLTYSRPYAGGTIGELFRRVLAAEAEPMTRRWPDCDEALANLVGRCLRRDPAGRYPSFEMLLPELIAIRDSYPEVAPSRCDLRGNARAASTAPRRETIPAAPSRSRSHPMPRPIASRARQSPSARPTRRPRSPLRRRTPFLLGAVDPAISKRRAAGSRRTLMAGLAAAATVMAIAITVFVPAREPTAAAAPAADVLVPPRSSGPAPGLLVVTAAPWGEVARLDGADGEPVELPAERTTPLRLWVAPGRTAPRSLSRAARSPPVRSMSSPAARISASRRRSTKRPSPTAPTTSRRWAGGSRRRSRVSPLAGRREARARDGRGVAR